jgi:hypothetical protein
LVIATRPPARGARRQSDAGIRIPNILRTERKPLRNLKAASIRFADGRRNHQQIS